MSLLDRVEGRGPMASEPTFSPVDDFWYRAVEGRETFAGFPVSADTAMRTSTVFACVSLIAETIASLPCILYRRLPDGGKERATDHWLYPILAQRPNLWQTRFEFIELLVRHLCLRGSGLADQRDIRTVGLLPLHPDRVIAEQLDTMRMRYRIRPLGAPEYTRSQDEILHIRDGGDDGIAGQARAALAREAIAVAAAGEAFVGSFFKHDATGRLLITHPTGLSPDKRADFRTMIAENYAGYQNRSKTMVLYGGVKAEELGKHDDSGFIVDPRKFQVSDVCRFWRVPPFMVGHEEKITWGTNIEQVKQGFVDFTARPWGTRIELALMRDLLTDQEQEDYLIAFTYDELLRGDTLARAQSYQIFRQIGVLNPDEIRAMENRNPREDGKGDVYQDTPTGAAPNADANARPPAQSSADGQQAFDVAPFIGDAAARISAAEIREVEKKAKTAGHDGAKWLAWMQKFYGEHRAYAVKVVQPLVAASGLEAWVADTVGERVEATALMALDAGVPAGWAERRPAEVEALIRDALAAGAAVRRAN